MILNAMPFVKTHSMMKFVFPVIATLLFLSATGDAAEAPPGIVAHEFESLANANASFPQVFLFRHDDAPPGLLGESADPRHRQAFINLLDGCIGKVVHEERTDLLTDQLRATYRELRAQHPEKSVLMHFNGEAVAVRHFDWIKSDRYHADNLKDYFPGHWLYHSGARLMNSITAKDTVLKVDETRPFSPRDYVFARAAMSGEDVSFPTDILLVPVAADGTRQWLHSEYATFVSKSKSEITVKRGRYGSTPRAFEGGKTLVLPFSGCSWADNSMWYFNFSPDCPRDSKGLQAADIYVRNLVASFKSPANQPPFANGIAFDVLDFELNPKFDTDNDSKQDGGLINGVNRWRLGVTAMLVKLRQQLGDEAIITADSHNPNSQRAVGLLNGMESEGLVTHDDAYRAISSTLNLQTYWLKYGHAPHFSYIVDKVRNEHDMTKLPLVTKLAHGVATVLGVGIGAGSATKYVTSGAIPYLAGESSPGKSGWLGKPTSGFMLLTAGPTFTDATAIVSAAKVEECILKQAGARELVLSSQKKSPQPSLGLIIENVDLTQGITLKLDLKSSEAIPGLEAYPAIPRTVTARLIGNPDYAKDAKLNKQYSECQGVAGATGWHTNTFHFRANPAKNVRLEISVQGSGALLIRNAEIMSGPLVVARRFENGAVVLNLSEQSWTAPAYTLGQILKPAPPTQSAPLILGPLETRFLTVSGKSL